MDRLLRRTTPVMLLLLAAAAIGEPWLPAGIRDLVGPGWVLRFAVAVVCIYLVLVIAERERMARDFKEVLFAFREFHGKKAAANAGGDSTTGTLATGEPTTAQKREALELLISALATSDLGVRSKAHAHLKRLTGQVFPADPAAWQAWLANS